MKGRFRRFVEDAGGRDAPPQAVLEGAARAGTITAAALALAVLGLLGCKVDPQYDGRSVRCDGDADCADLPGGDFECDLDAGLCVRVGGELPCVPECEHGECVDGECVCVPACQGGECVDGRCVCDPECGEGFVCGPVGLCEPECEPECLPVDRCVDGECVPGELGLEVFEPEDGFWMTDTVMFRGEVLWIDDEGDLSVECGIVGGEAVEASVTGLVELEDGLLRSDWDCNLTFGDVEGSEIEVLVEASAGPRTGSATLRGRRDTVAPVVVDTELGFQLGEEKIYEPQEVYLSVDARDCWTEGCEEADGAVGSVSFTHVGPGGVATVIEDFVCTGLGEAEVSCEVTLSLERDLDMERPVEHGVHHIEIEVVDQMGNYSGEVRVPFEVSRYPELELDVHAIDFVGQHGEEDAAVKRDGRFQVVLEVDRLDRVAVDDQGVLIAPLLDIRLGEEQDLPDWVEDSECAAPTDLSEAFEFREEGEGGQWIWRYSARLPCLPAVEAGYELRALIEDKWSRKPDRPRDLDAVVCDESAETLGENGACESMTITRRKWATPLCPEDTSGEDDPGGDGDTGNTEEACHVLTPAVAEDGGVYAAVNVEGSHELYRLHPTDGGEELIWSPTADDPGWYSAPLRDGPVVDVVDHGSEDGLRTHAYLWVDGDPGGILAILDGVDEPWRYPQTQIGGGRVRGLPAIGAAGRLYLPVSRLNLLVGGVEVLQPIDGSGLTVAGAGLDFAGEVSAALYSGALVDRVAVIDDAGVGGQTSCEKYGQVNCHGGMWQKYGAGRLGDVIVNQMGYAVVLRRLGGGSAICVQAWGSHGMECSDDDETDADFNWVTAGPVYGVFGDDGLRMVFGADFGLVFHAEEDGEADEDASGIVILGDEVQSLSLDEQGHAYALVRSSSRPRLVHAGPSGVVLEMRIADLRNDTITPILAAHPQATNDAPLGLLYIAAGGEILSIITDHGPATGWPNIRGCASRRSAFSGE